MTQSEALSSRQKTILAEARRWIGTPWHHQASECGVGTDCLGLVRGVYRVLMGSEPDGIPVVYARYVPKGSEETILRLAGRYLLPLPLAHPPIGSVLVFRLRPQYPARHLAILSEHNHLIHALNYQVVTELPYTGWWQKRCVACFAFPPPSGISS